MYVLHIIRGREARLIWSDLSLPVPSHGSFTFYLLVLEIDLQTEPATVLSLLFRWALSLQFPVKNDHSYNSPARSISFDILIFPLGSWPVFHFEGPIKAINCFQCLIQPYYPSICIQCSSNIITSLFF